MRGLVSGLGEAYKFVVNPYIGAYKKINVDIKSEDGIDVVYFNGQKKDISLEKLFNALSKDLSKKRVIDGKAFDTVNTHNCVFYENYFDEKTEETNKFKISVCAQKQSINDMVTFKKIQDLCKRGYRITKINATKFLAGVAALAVFTTGTITFAKSQNKTNLPPDPEPTTVSADIYDIPEDVRQAMINDTLRAAREERELLGIADEQINEEEISIRR